MSAVCQTPSDSASSERRRRERKRESARRYFEAELSAIKQSMDALLAAEAAMLGESAAVVSAVRFEPQSAYLCVPLEDDSFAGGVARTVASLGDGGVSPELMLNRLVQGILKTTHKFEGKSDSKGKVLSVYLRDSPVLHVHSNSQIGFSRPLKHFAAATAVKYIFPFFFFAVLRRAQPKAERFEAANALSAPFESGAIRSIERFALEFRSFDAGKVADFVAAPNANARLMSAFEVLRSARDVRVELRFFAEKGETQITFSFFERGAETGKAKFVIQSESPRISFFTAVESLCETIAANLNVK